MFDLVVATGFSYATLAVNVLYFLKYLKLA